MNPSPFTPIQHDISNYVQNRPVSSLSSFTLQCFVGMLQTGEATLDDFRAVGGDELVSFVESGLKIDWSNWNNRSKK